MRRACRIRCCDHRKNTEQLAELRECERFRNIARWTSGDLSGARVLHEPLADHLLIDDDIVPFRQTFGDDGDGRNAAPYYSASTGGQVGAKP